MSDKTGISWTDATWNPVRGCSRVSEGCRNCYAERVAARFSDPGMPYHGLARRVLKTEGASQPRWTGEVRLVADHLADPLHWKRPRRIFVNSMSDLFHDRLDDEQIDRVFAVMLLAPHHTFQVLTKRAARMRAYFDADDLYERILAAADALRRQWPRLNQIGIPDPSTSPARWIWLGVSVENQDAADERIPELLATPAAVRWISAEPLLGPVDLTRLFWRGRFENPLETANDQAAPHLGWCVTGCESGPGARPCDVEWLRGLRDQCGAAGVPFFLKQAVEDKCQSAIGPDGPPAMSIGFDSKRKAGGVIELPYLDGKQHAAFPEVAE